MASCVCDRVRPDVVRRDGRGGTRGYGRTRVTTDHRGQHLDLGVSQVSTLQILPYGLYLRQLAPFP